MAALLPLWSRDIPTRVAQNASVDPITAVFAYDPADPYAVTARFTVADLAVEWVFARELLASGLTGPVGEGDVHIRPGGHVLKIDLSSPDGRIELECSREPLEWFIKAVFTVVPAGSESQYVEVDNWLGELLHPQ